MSKVIKVKSDAPVSTSQIIDSLKESLPLGALQAPITTPIKPDNEFLPFKSIRNNDPMPSTFQSVQPFETGVTKDYILESMTSAKIKIYCDSDISTSKIFYSLCCSDNLFQMQSYIKDISFDKENSFTVLVENLSDQERTFKVMFVVFA
jgi:hypothetical protein